METAAYRSIKEWDVDDRPREKLLERGIGALTDAELVAILIGSGTRQLSAVDLGRLMLKEFGGLEPLAQATIPELMKMKGIGEAKAISIVTAFELARRKQLVDRNQFIITGPESGYRYLAPKIAHLPHEVFTVLLLNTRNQVIGEHQISSGSVKATVVDPKMVFKPAIAQYAVKILLAHNHPSGNPRPSPEDRDLTQKLVQAARFLEIAILDHLIITTQGYFSFADEGLL